MNWLCWLIDHKWRDGYSHRGVICLRCDAVPYDDVTLPEWFRNTRIVPRARKLFKQARLWLKSRKCWTPGHDWSPTSCYCRRCGMSGVEASERREWMLPEWKKLWRAYLADRFYIVKPYLKDQLIFAVQAFSTRWGIERSTIYIEGVKYMTRYIAYLGPVGLRLHKFFRGDDDRASHTHPWPFITFPFHSYVEDVFNEGTFKQRRLVKRLRFHYRRADFEHVVKGPTIAYYGVDLEFEPPVYQDEPFGFEPFWTFVITGPKIDEWGFYPKPGKFVYWRDYQSDKRNLVKS